MVGKQPVLRPGDCFEYQSACPLRTDLGSMEGEFEMVRPAHARARADDEGRTPGGGRKPGRRWGDGRSRDPQGAAVPCAACAVAALGVQLRRGALCRWQQYAMI